MLGKIRSWTNLTLQNCVAGVNLPCSRAGGRLASSCGVLCMMDGHHGRRGHLATSENCSHLESRIIYRCLCRVGTLSAGSLSGHCCGVSLDGESGSRRGPNSLCLPCSLRRRQCKAAFQLPLASPSLESLRCLPALAGQWWPGAWRSGVCRVVAVHRDICSCCRSSLQFRRSHPCRRSNPEGQQSSHPSRRRSLGRRRRRLLGTVLRSDCFGGRPHSNSAGWCCAWTSGSLRAWRSRSFSNSMGRGGCLPNAIGKTLKSGSLQEYAVGQHCKCEGDAITEC